MYLNDCKAITRFSDVEDTTLNGRGRGGERPVNASGEKTKHGKIRIRIRIDGAKGLQQGNRFKTSCAGVHRLSWRFYRVTLTVVRVQYIERTYVHTYDSRNTWLCDCNQRCTDSIAQLVYYVTPNVVHT